ncbi:MULTISPECIES: CPXCG motif-containing cysteine-rich protein [Halomonadaceae]|nr:MULTISPECIES: CPXCG motif-containing cysteine-rich protein [Halomonas]MCD6007255.1 CPXCG motif-containing cysteine-rich protein [Halomonas sp. IOP_31]
MHEAMLASRPVSCPYCGTPFELLVDGSQGSHSTWEDCPRCCAPIQVSVDVAEPDGSVQAVTLARDDDVL